MRIRYVYLLQFEEEIWGIFETEDMTWEALAKKQQEIREDPRWSWWFASMSKANGGSNQPDSPFPTRLFTARRIALNRIVAEL